MRLDTRHISDSRYLVCDTDEVRLQGQMSQKRPLDGINNEKTKYIH